MRHGSICPFDLRLRPRAMKRVGFVCPRNPRRPRRRVDHSFAPSRTWRITPCPSRTRVERQGRQEFRYPCPDKAQPEHSIRKGHDSWQGCGGHPRAISSKGRGAPTRSSASPGGQPLRRRGRRPPRRRARGRRARRFRGQRRPRGRRPDRGAGPSAHGGRARRLPARHPFLKARAPALERMSPGGRPGPSLTATGDRRIRHRPGPARRSAGRRRPRCRPAGCPA